MRIRPALLSDASDISALPRQLGYEARPQQVSILLAPLLEREDHLVLVAEDELSKVSGWVHVFISRRAFVAPFAEPGGMIVDDAHRGSGLGRALLEGAEDGAHRAGCSMLR